MISYEEFNYGIWPILLFVAFISIVPLVIVHYITMGLNPYLFLGFELPLYLFLIWAMARVFKIKHNIDKFYKNEKEQ